MNLHLSFHPRSLRRASILALVLGVLFLLILASTLIVGGSPDLSELAAVMNTPTISAEAFCAQWFTLDPKLLPPVKLAAEQAAYDDCVRARRSTASVSARVSAVRPLPRITFEPTRPPCLAPADIPHRAAGNGTVLEEGSSIFPGHYLIENQWWETVGGQCIHVFAGARRGDGANDLPKPWQGMVFVLLSALDGTRLPGGGTYETPSKVGSVKIVAAQGQRLVLKADDGTTFYFDLPTRQFVPSLTATVTPVKPTLPPYP